MTQHALGYYSKYRYGGCRGFYCYAECRYVVCRGAWLARATPAHISKKVYSIGAWWKFLHDSNYQPVFS
jgi:hypothetical protein